MLKRCTVEDSESPSSNQKGPKKSDSNKKRKETKSPDLNPVAGGSEDDDEADDDEGHASRGRGRGRKKQKKTRVGKPKEKSNKRESKKESKKSKRKPKHHEDGTNNQQPAEQKPPTPLSTVEAALQAVEQAEKDAVARRTIEVSDSDADSDSDVSSGASETHSKDRFP